jgi:hypothetical protein
MGTTTNYGWPTPVATDLVKDGWEAIKDLGDAIDTTAASSFASKVVQIVSASTTTVTSNSTNVLADTTLTATITPTSASNKVLVLVTQSGVTKSAANSNNGVNINLYRGATLISEIGRYVGFTNSTLLLSGLSATNSFLDTPATTSATTYKTQFRNDSNTASVTVQDGSARSTIVLMEVVA